MSAVLHSTLESIDRIEKHTGASICAIDAMILRMAIAIDGDDLPAWLAVNHVAHLPRYSAGYSGVTIRVAFFAIAKRLHWVVEKLNGPWSISKLTEKRFYVLSLDTEDAVMYRMNWQD